MNSPFPLLPLSLLLLLLPPPALSQTTGGSPGYIRVPSATFNADATLWFGAGFLPKQYLEYSRYTYNAISAYGSITFLGFVEIDLRVTRRLNIPAGSNHVVDRVPTVRFRLLRENWRGKKWIPSVTVGAQDFISSLESGKARHFGASYLVVTKNFTIAKTGLRLEASLGYGTNWLIWYNNEFIGPFGGLSLTHEKLNWLTLLADYDGHTVNAGLRAVCFKHLILMAGLLNFEAVTAGVSYRFSIAGKQGKR